MAEQFKLAAEWTDDCLGKKDYDGTILEISTRYWPAGGGFIEYRGGQFLDNKDRPEIKPSTKCELLIHHKDGEECYCLIERDFKGESFEEVKAKVEAFAQEQMDKAVKALLAAFYVDPNGSP